MVLLSREQLFSLVEAIFLSIDTRNIQVADSVCQNVNQAFDWHVTVPLNVVCCHSDDKAKSMDKHLLMAGVKDVGLVLSAQMFGKDQGQLSISDLQDAVGEVANMAADKVRAEIGSEESIGLPKVLTKDQFDDLLGQSDARVDFHGLLHNKPFYIAVIQ